LSKPQYVIVTFRRLSGETGQPGRHEWLSWPAVTTEIFDLKAGGCDGAALGVSDEEADGIKEASPDGEVEPWPDGDVTEDGAGSATTPVPPHAVTVADTQARARTPRWRSFRISDIRQGKAILTPLVTQL
jgi:hypothetical protein